jgi:hypothetical protein
MDFNLITVNGTIHKVNHMEGVGFYVDIDGKLRLSQPRLNFWMS